jgi:hypothetical protein
MKKLYHKLLLHPITFYSNLSTNLFLGARFDNKSCNQCFKKLLIFLSDHKERNCIAKQYFTQYTLIAINFSMSIIWNKQIFQIVLQAIIHFHYQSQVDWKGINEHVLYHVINVWPPSLAKSKSVLKELNCTP